MPARGCIDDMCYGLGECALTDRDGNCPVVKHRESARATGHAREGQAATDSVSSEVMVPRLPAPRESGHDG
jgi:hypothetical protein